MLLIAVLSTSLIVHVLWMWTASRSVETIVSSLNSQTSYAAVRELQQAFKGAEAACARNDIKHRLIESQSLWPSRHIERMSRTIEVTA